MARAQLTMPPAELDALPSDIPDHVVHEVLKNLSFLQGVQEKNQPNTNRFPNTLKIRHFARGDVLCHQGDAGWTAFIILTGEDVLEVLRTQYEQEPNAEVKQRIEQEIATVEDRMTNLPPIAEEPEHPKRRAATVRIQLPDRTEQRPGIFRRMFDKILGRARPTAKTPLAIPIDGPADVPFQTLQVPLHEGELVGELSCLYGTPRSAMIVADRSCYVVEMLRNILDQIRDDDSFAARMDEVYRRRVLETHLRGLGLFRDLSEEMFERIRDRVELIRLRDGEIICDEFDRSDSVYIVRGGLVRVLKGVSSLLRTESVVDGTTLLAQLKTAIAQPQSPAGFLTSELPDPLRSRLADTPTLDEELTAEVVDACNTLIKSPDLHLAKEVAETAKRCALAEKAELSEVRPREWSALSRRRFNRLLLEAVFENCFEPVQQRTGPELILTYLSRGEIIGEMGVVRNAPRSATCVAHVMPPSATTTSERSRVRHESTKLVELVRIPKEVFDEIVASQPAIGSKVQQIADSRTAEDTNRQQSPKWDSTGNREQSQRFTELGLIQGQRLMLIDLNRCTRCDECVQACVDTHTDGRTRLFLDGPRYGQYLVPSTCRACRDPLCLIGCPVGSIHRGDNGEIAIEDWCIGCSLCEKNCPYGSIQMHDIGIIAEATYGWRYRLVQAEEENSNDAAPPKWVSSKYNEQAWSLGATPFLDGHDFRTSLGELPGSDSPKYHVQFRHTFEMSSPILRHAKMFKLVAKSTCSDVRIWLNGSPLTEESNKKGTYTYSLPPQAPLRVGKNQIAVQVDLDAKNVLTGQAVLHLRLDEEKIPQVVFGEGEFNEKMVEKKAVVCDLCSTVSGQRPACVTACPHDAAIRIDALTNFPDS